MIFNPDGAAVYPFGRHVRRGDDGELLGHVHEEEIEVSGTCACERVLRARGVRSKEKFLRESAEKLLSAHRQVCTATSEVRWVVASLLPETLELPTEGQV